MKEKLWTKKLVVIILSNFLLFMSFQMLLPTLPVYATSIGASEMVAGLIISIFAISAIGSRLYSGLLMDLKGRKGVLIAGIFIFVISSFLYNIAVSITFLLFLRVIHGLGWGAATTAFATIAADIIPQSRRGEGLGYFGLSNAFSMIMGPAIGIFIIEQFNFNYLFMVSALLAIFSLLLLQTISLKSNHQKPNQVKQTFFEKSSLRTSIVLFFLTFLYGGVVTFIPLYTFSLGIRNSGMFYSIFAVFLLLSRPVAGKLLDYKGSDIVVIPGFLITTIGIVILSFVQSYYYLLLSGLILGIGFGMVMPSLQALTVTLADPERKGAANAIYFSAYDLGIAAGAAVLGILSSWIGYSKMYLISSVAGILGLIFYWKLFCYSKQNYSKNTVKKVDVH